MISKLLCALSCFALTSVSPLSGTCSPPEGRNGAVETKQPLAGIDTIDASGAYRLDVVKSDKQEMTISGDASWAARISTRVDGKTLSIWEHEPSSRPRAPLVVTVSLPKLAAISIRGAINAQIDAFSGQSLDLKESGAVNVSIKDLKFTKLYARVEGASSLRAAGRADQILLELVGASQLSGGALTGETAELHVTGSSKATLGACRKLTGAIDGASTLNYLGTRDSSSGVRVSMASSIYHSTR